MTNSEILIPIPGRLHSVADVTHVAGADEIYDDLLSKSQETINGESAYIEADDGSSVIPSFDPETDTVWNKQQTLSAAQKAQARTNIGALGSDDIASLESKVTIQSASGATLTAVVGKYYTMSNVGTLAITLPTIAAGTTTLQMVAFYISAGSSPAVTFSSTHSIYYSEGFEIAANTTYEVNAAYNGIAWVVTSVKIVIPSA